MSTGVPSVVTDVPSVNESITHMHDGLLVSFGDINAFSQAVNYLIEDKKTRQLLAFNARDTVSKKFNIKEKANLYDSLYQKIATPQKHGFR